MHSAANDQVSYTFRYDAANRLIEKSDSRGWGMSFTYDRVGNIQTKTDYQGDTTTYTYDSANRRVAMKNPAYLSATYQHDGAGRVLARLLSNGAQTQYAWEAGQLTGIKTITANGSQLNDVAYTRDRVGNILEQTDASGTTIYDYDALYRLTSADYPGTANDDSFLYDAVGNRASHTSNGQVHAYEYPADSNQLKAIHANSVTGAVEIGFSYDDEGRLTEESGSTPKTLIWDQKNRVSTVNGVAYRYDPMNYRIGQANGVLGNREYFLEGEHLEAEYAGWDPQATYFRGLSTDELLAGYSHDAHGEWVPAIYHHDTLMSVTGISAHDGATVQTASYSAFGDRTVAGVGTSSNRLTYTGRERAGLENLNRPLSENVAPIC